MTRDGRTTSWRKLGPWLMAAGVCVSAALGAEPLAPPTGLQVVPGAGTRFEWQAVPEAALYRVAVFDALDADGKRPLLAAVWVRGSAWDYGSGAVVPKAGRLASTQPLPLPAGHALRVMVSAAREDGADKSEWVGEDFTVALPAPTATPTPAPAPKAAASAAASADAEIELEGGEEFQSSPDPAIIEVHEAGAAVAAGGPIRVQVETPQPPSLDTARGYFKAGNFDAAELQYRELLKTEPANADLWEGLGDALLARRLKAEAYEAYSQALLLDSSRKNLREWIKVNVPRR